ncbi:MAG: BLUF domain-containing protein [Comamonadaceae bacterium]|nr:MAG: BLUF domain-containing protein [Comamonadaceae bacterium]
MSSIAFSQFLYCSLLSAQAAPTCVADILRTARRANAERHITGVLVFDGERFCQYFEGPSQQVADLAARIGQDPCHTGFEPLYHGPLLGARRFPAWPMAYALASDIEPLERLCALRGLPAVELLTDLIPEFDLGPAVAA